MYTSTAYSVKGIEGASVVHVFVLTKKEREAASWMEARVKGHSAPLSLENHCLSHEYAPDLIALVCRG